MIKEKLYDFGVFGKWSKATLRAQCVTTLSYGREYCEPPKIVTDQKNEKRKKITELLDESVTKRTRMGDIIETIEQIELLNKGIDDYQKMDSWVYNNIKP